MIDSGEAGLRADIEKAIAGDQEAFSRLYGLYFKPVYRYLYFRTRSREEAEDLAQEVFIKAYRSFGRYRYTGKDPLAYFHTIAHNALIDRSRKKRPITVGEESAPDAPDTAPTPVEARMRDDEAAALRAQIAQLPKEQQDVIVLRFIQDLSTQEIADLLGKKESAVRKLQSRGLHSLREILNNDHA